MAYKINLKESFQKIKIPENVNLYCQILCEHFCKKRLMIVIFAIITLILLVINNDIAKALSGISISALVTVMFLDSINQYVDEQKFLDVSKDVKNKVYSLYFNFCELIFTLDKGNMSIGEQSNYRNSNEIIQNSKKLYSYCEQTKFKHTKELSKNESYYANQYLQKLKDNIDVSIENIKNSSPNIEIYELLYTLNNLQKEFKHANNNFFTPTADVLSNIFGGINDSLIKNSFKQYLEVLSKIDNNKILNILKLTLTKEMIIMCELPDINDLKNK